MRFLRSQPLACCVATVLLLPACAPVAGSTGGLAAPISISTRSYHRSDIDVYLLCGQRDARWLGVVSKKGVATFEVPAQSAQCVSGLNFFLVRQDQSRGYWVGPVRPRAGGQIELVIERYAPLSTASVLGRSASSIHAHVW